MPELKSIPKLLKSIDFWQVLSILQNTRLKARQDRQYSQRTKGPLQSPGLLKQMRSLPNGARYIFDQAELEVIFLASDITRLSWTPGNPPLPYAIDKKDWPSVPITQRSSPNQIISSATLEIEIFPDGAVHFRSATQKHLRQEPPPQFQTVIYSGQDKEDFSWTAFASLPPEEQLVGLGEQSGPFNLRQRSHRLWNNEAGGNYKPGTDPIYMPLPVYLGLNSQGSYLIFYENYHDTFLMFSDQLSRLTFEGGMLQYYFISGPPAQALEKFTELTGRTPLPPLWGLGYHQCRWGYRTEADIREVVAGFIENDMPISAIHLDIDYMQDYRVFTINPQRFPDLARLSAELLKQDLHLITILDPGVKQDPEYFVYQEGLKRQTFCLAADGKPAQGVVWPGWCVFPDFTNSKTRAWWGEYYQRLLEAGITGFWHDMNEPSSFTASKEMTLPLSTRHTMDGQIGNHHQAHNLYALQMNRAGYEALRKLRPNQRPWIISRSGWVSQQRYAWNWTGDTNTSWESLRMTLTTVLGLGLSGIPFSGPDIGGFSGNPSAELYLRWFQLAAFLPYFRTHSSRTSPRREPWVFGEPYTSIIRRYMRLHYKLLPYLYTLAWEASQTGAPLVRPLFWIEPDNPDLWDISDSFLLGNNLLVAPVLEEKAASRQVTLPAGTWLSFWDDRFYPGSSSVSIPVNLEQIPLFVRADSILPLVESGQLHLHLYSTQDHLYLPNHFAGSLYCDAGDGYGESRLDHFYLRGDGSSLYLQCRSTGNYPFPYQKTFLHVHGVKVKTAYVDGVPFPFENNRIETGYFLETNLEL